MFSFQKKIKPAYLDFASTTPISRRVLDSMSPYFQDKFGNPSSLHAIGEEAALAVISARKSIAELLGVTPKEIIFTSGATESINLAIIGFANNLHFQTNHHFITTQVEHDATLSCFKELQRRGHEVTYLSVDQRGQIDSKDLLRSIKSSTRLVSIIHANNETGEIIDIKKVAKILNKYNRENRGSDNHIVLHSDACQSAGLLDLDVRKLGVDMLTINASKLYGPKGSGLLLVRKGVQLAPVIFGGGQEGGLRSGTENVAGIVGFAESMLESESLRESLIQKYEELREYLIDKVKAIHPEVIVVGGEEVLPNFVSMIFAGIEGESLLYYLNNDQVYVSSGSACSTKTSGPSHVLLAQGYGDVNSRCAIRVSMGRSTTKSDIDRLIQSIKKSIPLLLNVDNEILKSNKSIV